MMTIDKGRLVKKKGVMVVLLALRGLVKRRVRTNERVVVKVTVIT